MAFLCMQSGAGIGADYDNLDLFSLNSKIVKALAFKCCA